MTPIRISIRAALVLAGGLAALPPASVASPAGSADPGADRPDGRALHAEHCVRCHGSEVYTRPAPLVRSREALGQRVLQCAEALDLRWFDDAVAAVAGYLDAAFYHFER